MQELNEPDCTAGGSDGSSVYWGRQSVLVGVLSASTQQYHVSDRIIKCLNSKTNL